MKNFKRMVAMAATLVMCCMVSITTSGSKAKAAVTAAQGSWLDNGNYTKDWVSNETGKDVYGHEGTASDPYEIQNGQDLAALSYCTNNMGMSFNDKYITITAAELDMSQHNWEPIAEKNPIYGTMNGNGCTINNLSIGNSKSYYRNYYGAFIGQSCADISNINLKNIRYYTNSMFTGGFLGLWSAGSINNCSVQGLILSASNGCSIGGLVGTGRAAEGKTLGTITDCTTSVEIGNYANARGVNAVGGLIAALNSETSIENCTIAIETEVYNKHYVGGAVGFVSACTKFDNCSITYYIYAKDSCSCGGVAGKVNSCNISVSNCNENGNIMNGSNL